jgi:amidase
VEDTAFLLAAMAGPDLRSPVSIAEAGSVFLKPLKRNFRKTRIAWSRDLRGLPFDPKVLSVVKRQKQVFEDLGCIVEETEPDFSGATEAFETLRALGFLQSYGEFYRTRRNDLKDTVQWNVEQGMRLTPEQVARATALRSQLYQRMRAFLEKYEFLVCPVNQLPPYPVETEWPREIAGVKLDNYLDWMKSCYYITITSHPAISVPAGFTADDPPLPVGIQIVGRYRADFSVLQLAAAFESATETWKRRPDVLDC